MKNESNKVRSGIKNNSGFSLIELMVTMAIATIILAGIYAAYQAQLRTHVTQQAVVDIQQNLRSSMYYIQRSLRMAGHNPEGLPADQVGFLENFTSFNSPHASSGAATDGTSIAFAFDVTGQHLDSLDNDGDGQTDEDDERIADGTINETLENELNAFRLNGNTLESWIYTGPADADYSWQPIADNIQSLEFLYLLDTDDDGVIDAETDDPVGTGDLANIRSVRITITAQPVEELYMRAVAKRPHVLSVQIRCRNL